MHDPEEIRRRKRRCNVSVLSGVALMLAAMVVSGPGRALWPTTVAAVLGFALLMYGVHVGWLVFYDRESDGPPS